MKIASSETHTLDQLHVMLTSNSLQEASPRDMSEMSKIVLEASRVATEKMLDYYQHGHPSDPADDPGPPKSRSGRGAKPGEALTLIGWDVQKSPLKTFLHPSTLRP